MSERSSVSITIRMSDFLAHKKFFEHEANTVAEDGLAVILEKDECSGGDWSIVEDFLISRKMEFDKFWESGGNYEHGNAYFRHINGKYKNYEIYATEESILEQLAALQEVFDKDVKKGLKALKKEIKKRMPWDAKSLKTENSIRFIREA